MQFHDRANADARSGFRRTRTDDRLRVGRRPAREYHTKLVRSLSEEAEARQIAVVSRGAPAQYRVRIYAATVVYAKRSVVHWVWDVYDANQQRARRLSGEEPMSGAGRTTWAAADDQVIRKIARVGMDRLVAFLGSSPREPAHTADAAERCVRRGDGGRAIRRKRSAIIGHKRAGPSDSTRRKMLSKTNPSSC